MPTDDNKQTLYNNLIKSGRVTENEIGTYDTFSANMADSANVSKLYQGLRKNDLFKEDELGTYDTFYKNVGTPQSGQPVQQEQQPQGKMSFAEWKDSPQYSEGSSYDDYLKGQPTQQSTPIKKSPITQDQADNFIKGLNPMVREQLDKVSQGTPEEVEAKLKANNVPQEQINQALKYKQAVDRNRIVANAVLPTLTVQANPQKQTAGDKDTEQQEQNKTDQFNLKLGQSFVANGKLEEGLSLIKSVADNNPKAKEYTDYSNRMNGYVASNKKDFVGAAQAYDAIKEKNNDDYNNSAYAKLKSGNIAGASNDIGKVLTSPLTVDNIDQHLYAKKIQLNLAGASGNEDLYKDAANGLKMLELRKSQINGEFTSANFEDFADNLPFFMQPFYRGEYKGLKDIEAGYEQGGAAGFTKSLMGATGVIMNAIPAVAEFNIGSAVLAKGTDKIQSLFVDDPEKLMKQGGIGTTVTNTVSDYLFGAVTKGLKATGIYDKMPESLQNLAGAGDLILGGIVLHKTIGFAKDIRDIGKDIEKTMPFPDAQKSLKERMVDSFKNVSTVLTNKKDGKPNTQADAEAIVTDATEALKNQQVVDHIKAQLEQSNERDKVVTDAQAKGTLKPDVETFTLPKTQETLDNIKNGTPTLNVDLDEASNNLYEEYKRLEKTKAADTRTNTIDQISAKQEEIGKQIADLSDLAKKQKVEGFPEETGTTETSPDTTENKPTEKETGKYEVKMSDDGKYNVYDKDGTHIQGGFETQDEANKFAEEQQAKPKPIEQPIPTPETVETPEQKVTTDEKPLTALEKAEKEMKDAYDKFHKSRGTMSMGGIESMPALLDYAGKYIKYQVLKGIDNVKDLITQFRKDHPDITDKEISDKDIEDKFNEVGEEKEEDGKPKSFNDHVFELINSATDAADLKTKLEAKEKEFRDAGKYDEADKIKELNNSIKDGDDIGDVTNKILDDQIKEADPFRKTKTDKAKEFISDSAIGTFGKKIFNGVKFIFNKVFPSNSKTAQEARQILRKEQGNLKSEIANLISGKASGFFENSGINAWSNSLESVRNLFDKIGKDGSFKFMNLMQGIVDGKARDATLSAMDKQYGLEEGTLQKALDNLRNTSDKLFDMVADHSDVNYVTDYLAGMYKDYDKARVYFAGKLNNIAGKKSFLKQKFYSNYLQAKEEGKLTPLYDNPADIVNHQVGNVMQYVYANRILDAFKDNGMAEYYPNAKDVPEGMSLVKDPIFQRKTFIPPTEEGKPAVVTEAGGGWYLPNDAADMVNNKFGKGLIAPEVESSVQALNNFYVRADLSFSYFHTMMSSMNSLAGQFGGAIQNLTAFKPLAALKEMARIPLAQDLFDGIKLNRDAKRVDDLKQQLADANSKGNTKVAADLQKRINNVKMLTDANHQFNLDRQNRMDMVDAFRRSVRRNEKLPALIKAPLAAIDAFMRPLMQVYVPALKSSVAMRNAAREIELVQPKTEFERQNLINRAVDGSDEMFGQIAHDNLFFDNTLKQLGNMSALAFGYSRGTLMTLLRPVTEMGKFQQGEGGGLKSETLSRLVKGKGVPIGTSNFLGIVASTCFVGAMMQKLMSGKDPESIQDLIAPRTGEKNPDGTDKRLVFSNYLSKDYYGYSKGFFHELENKSSPLIRITSELVKNKDFYGGVIMPEDEKPWQKAWDGVKFAGKEAIPFSFRHNPAKEYEDYSKGKEDLLQYFGIREASKEMERNTWQNAIVDESAKSGSEKPKTDLQLDKSRLKGTAAGEIYSGKTDKGNELLQKGVTKGYWKQSEVSKMAEDFKVNPYYRMFKTLSPEGQLRVYKEMTPEVQGQLKPYLHKPDVWEKLKKELPDKADEINKVLGTSNTKDHKEHPVKVHKVGKHIKNDEQTPDEPTSENHIESKFDRNKLYT